MTSPHSLSWPRLLSPLFCSLSRLRCLSFWRCGRRAVQGLLFRRGPLCLPPSKICLRDTSDLWPLLPSTWAHMYEGHRWAAHNDLRNRFMRIRLLAFRRASTLPPPPPLSLHPSVYPSSLPLRPPSISLSLSLSFHLSFTVSEMRTWLGLLC